MPYLDAASTESLHPVARQALLAALDEGWADPSRLYGDARRARLLLDAARETTAEVIGARPDEVFFCANGTQAVHSALLGALRARRRAGDLLLTSAVEHSSVLATARWHQDGGGRFALVPVDGVGRVDMPAFERQLSEPGVAVASLQSANHEVGTLQPAAHVAQACSRAGVPLHVDAAVTAGRVSGALQGWSYLTASAHKWGGPAGVGILAIRTGARWQAPFPEDDRQSGRVPGFENVPAIVAAAASLAARDAELAAEYPRLRAMNAWLRTELERRVPDVQVFGDPDPAGRVPHLVAFSCLYVEGEALLDQLDRAGIAVSSGSSCTASTLEPSHVLTAMGALTGGNVRVSLGRGTTQADVEHFMTVLPDAVARIREAAGVQGL